MISICPVRSVPEENVPFADVLPVNAIFGAVLSMMSVLVAVPDMLPARSVAVPE